MNIAMPWPSMTMAPFADAKQVGKGPAIVAHVAFFLGDAFAGVFEHDRALGNVLEGEAAGGMNVGGARNQARQRRILRKELSRSIA